MSLNTVGSIWRIWDLQVQTILDDQYIELERYHAQLKVEQPDLWSQFIAKLGSEENALLYDSKKYVFNQEISQKDRYTNYARVVFTFLEIFRPNLGLIAITDHNYYDSALIDFLFEYSQKAVCKCISGVEINASGVHMLVYFEQPPYGKQSFSDGIKTFLDHIDVHEPKKGGVLSVSTESVVNVIKEIDKNNGIYVFPHCNSSNGLFQERGKTDRTHLADIFNFKPVVFLQCHTKDGIEKTGGYIKTKNDLFFSDYVFSISKDSRCLKDIGASDDKGNYTWVKADCHFFGLKQILIERDRVFVGEEPELLKRVRKNPTKFISSLSVQKQPEAILDDVWFDNFKVNLNSGLVAIIGNKGAGKSAITDILSLCGNTHQDPLNFSFLTTSKFRKVKPVNLSEKFVAEIVWKDGTPTRIALNQNPDKKLPERVRYIPQHFLEKLCTSVDSNEFENEIKQIIFSHTPVEYRLSKSSLDELINYKSTLVVEEINKIKSSISKLNVKIIESEKKTSNDYKIEIDNAVKLRKNELEAHDKIKPSRPITAEDETSSELTSRINGIRTRVENLEKEVGELNSKKVSEVLKAEEVNHALQYFNNLKDQIEKDVSAGNLSVQTLLNYGIKVEDVFKYEVNTKSIENLLAAAQQSVTEIGNSLNEKLPESKVSQLNELWGEIRELQDQLDRPAKEQQKYIDDLRQWEAQRKGIEGDVKIEGSLNFLINHLNFLDNDLPVVLQTQYDERKTLMGELFDKKQELLKIRRELFQPVTDFIENFKELKARYDVKLNVTLEYQTFLNGIFTYINQGRIGSFSGKEEGYKRMVELLEKSQFDTKEGFEEFTTELLENLNFDKRAEENSAVAIETQLKKGIELYQLYDFIFQFEYLHPVYNLNLGSKSLLELSPGERGALLLIFYLILDKDDIPLLIDQPEENLDNESVYLILVHFIKKVKEHRQIIIVTHNPNLAIVCDAEQIIHMNIEKEDKNTVRFQAGSIENLKINKSAVDILEGTLPAFNNRDSKYIRTYDGKRIPSGSTDSMQVPVSAN